MLLQLPSKHQGAQLPATIVYIMCDLFAGAQSRKGFLGTAQLFLDSLSIPFVIRIFCQQ